jgi:hypothetical protein
MVASVQQEEFNPMRKPRDGRSKIHTEEEIFDLSTRPEPPVRVENRDRRLPRGPKSAMTLSDPYVWPPQLPKREPFESAFKEDKEKKTIEIDVTKCAYPLGSQSRRKPAKKVKSSLDPIRSRFNGILVPQYDAILKGISAAKERGLEPTFDTVARLAAEPVGSFSFTTLRGFIRLLSPEEEKSLGLVRHHS